MQARQHLLGVVPMDRQCPSGDDDPSQIALVRISARTLGRIPPISLRRRLCGAWPPACRPRPLRALSLNNATFSHSRIDDLAVCLEPAVREPTPVWTASRFDVDP